MAKAFATMIGLLLTGHGFLGLFVEGEHLLQFNADFVLDLTYLALGVILLVAGTPGPGAVVVLGALLLTAAALVLIGILGLVDHRLFGLAPTGFTPLDFVLLFGLAFAAVIGMLQRHPGEPLWVIDQQRTVTSNANRPSR